MTRKTESRMRKAFWVGAGKVLAFPKKFQKNNDILRVGVESEVAIYNQQLAMDEYEAIRNEIINGLPWADIELGAEQVESRTEPHNLLNGGISALFDEYHQRTAIILERARSLGCSVIRCGSNPFIPVLSAPITKKEKYKIVPPFHDLHRRARARTHIGRDKNIRIDRAGVISLFQSFQPNLEAQSFEDAIEKLNYSLMIGPAVLALGANARYLELKDSGMDDMRKIVWAYSHDIRTKEDLHRGLRSRIGLPEGYFDDLRHYFERVSRFPFILDSPDHALEIGIGLHWTDTRIKVVNNSLVVEFRLLPTQPSIEDEMALLLFWLGRIIYAQVEQEQLLPFRYVNSNRLSAMKYGLNGFAWVRTRRGVQKRTMKELVSEDMQKAFNGLEIVGIKEMGWMSILRERLNIGNHSDELAKKLKEKTEVTEEEMQDTLVSCGMLIG